MSNATKNFQNHWAWLEKQFPYIQKHYAWSKNNEIECRMNLNQETTKKCFFTCQQLLLRQNLQGFIQRIVSIFTGDVKWIHYDNPRRKKPYVHASHALSLTPKSNIHTSKLMLCFRCDQLGFVYYELLQSLKIVHRRCLLVHWRPFGPSIERKTATIRRKAKWRIFTKGLHFSRTVETLKLQVLSHPLYSPDIAPSDYHLFQSMAHDLTDLQLRFSKETKNWIDL